MNLIPICEMGMHYTWIDYVDYGAGGQYVGTIEGMVTGDRVVCETPNERRIVVRGCVLERPDAQMARRDSGEHRAGQHGVARDLLAGRHHSQRPGSGDAE